MAGMMHCAVVEKFGAPLALKAMAIPTPGPGQILVMRWYIKISKR